MPHYGFDTTSKTRTGGHIDRVGDEWFCAVSSLSWRDALFKVLPRVAPLLLALLLVGCAFHRARPLAQWSDSMSDGCSIPGGEAHAPIPFTLAQHRCCVRHDALYYPGGSFADRWRADVGLRECLTGAGINPAVADLMFAAVRAFGGPEFRVPGVSWAFGNQVFKYSDRPLNTH